MGATRPKPSISAFLFAQSALSVAHVSCTAPCCPASVRFCFAFGILGSISVASPTASRCLDYGEAEISRNSTVVLIPASHRPDPAADPALSFSLSLCYCWAVKSSGRQPSSAASGVPSSAPACVGLVWVAAHTRSACECMGVYVYATSTLGPYIRTSPQRTPILRAFLTYLCRFMVLLILHKKQKDKKSREEATTNKNDTLCPRPLDRVVVGSLSACS